MARKRPKLRVASKPSAPVAEVIAVSRSRGTTKFTAAARTAILASVRKGLPRVYAAALAGIGERPLPRWTASGRANLVAVDDSASGGLPAQLDAHGRFLLELIAAESSARAEILGVVRKAALDGDTKAAEWLLERADPRRFGSGIKVEAVVRDEDGEEHSAAPSAGDLLIAKLDAIERRLVAAAGGPNEAEAADGTEAATTIAGA